MFLGAPRRRGSFFGCVRPGQIMPSFVLTTVLRKGWLCSVSSEQPERERTEMGRAVTARVPGTAYHWVTGQMGTSRLKKHQTILDLRRRPGVHRVEHGWSSQVVVVVGRSSLLLHRVTFWLQLFRSQSKSTQPHTHDQNRRNILTAAATCRPRQRQIMLNSRHGGLDLFRRPSASWDRKLDRPLVLAMICVPCKPPK